MLWIYRITYSYGLYIAWKKNAKSDFDLDWFWTEAGLFLTWANFSSVFDIIMSNASRCMKIFLLWFLRYDVLVIIGSETYKQKNSTINI